MSRREALIAKFRAITGERVAKVRRGLRTLETTPGDHGSASEVNRELHTLKGEAKLLGFVAISGVALALEELFAVAEANAFRSLGGGEGIGGGEGVGGGEGIGADELGAEGLLGVGLDVIDALRALPADDPTALADFEAYASRVNRVLGRAVEGADASTS